MCLPPRLKLPSQCIPGVHEVSAICGMSLKPASAFLLGALVVWKAVHCSSEV